VVGWEFDYGWPGSYVRQSTSWTIMARKDPPHLMQVIDDILDTLHAKLEENNLSVENATLKIMGDVVDFTGPRRLTYGVYKSLGKQLNRTIEGGDLAEILQPKMLGNVLVMPGRSFAASLNTYTPEEEAQLPPQLVEHHYAGTWKNDQLLRASKVTWSTVNRGPQTASVRPKRTHSILSQYSDVVTSELKRTHTSGLPTT
jgi:alpha 1,6-mannosyltransferase